MTFFEGQFWTALLQIIGINIVLSGDNAVVIALAARNLPAKQRRWAVIGGTVGAVVMRIGFTVIVVYLMTIPYLKLVGSALLFWIAIKLLVPEGGGGEGKVKAGSSIGSAITTIIIADAVMSLDNVIGIAAAAKDSLTLVILGLAISIPIVVFGSTLMLKLLDRYPILVVGGGALLGWVAGDIAAADPAIEAWIEPYQPIVHYLAAAGGAGIVVLAGTWLARRKEARQKKVDIVASEHHGVSGS
ncbi:MAG: TerC family protein [Rhodospirillales bacterium]|nr:TerC family protein [Rhodospirillales bacterium]